jgi:glycine cleavage system transcriptional repressor
LPSFALAAIGRDRPGIVAAVAKVLYELGCNVEDSSMTLLRGNFSMQLVIAAPGAVSPADVESALRPSCEAFGLMCTVREVDDEATVPQPSHVLTVYGADKPGILFRTCELLADAGVNITDLDSRLVGDADALYAVLLELEVPASVDIATLEGRLRDLAADVGVDVVLNERDAPVL